MCGGGGGRQKIVQVRTGKAFKCDRSGVNKSDCKGMEETAQKVLSSRNKSFCVHERQKVHWGINGTA